MTISNTIVSEANEALYEGLYKLTVFGDYENSRVGKVIVLSSPAITTYLKPRNRVLRAPLRDANPFFHLFEAMWMLQGSNSLAFLTQFVKTFSKYSDDGETLHGAYGFRWRKHFGFDQIQMIIEELRVNPNTRRAVLTMWEPNDLSVAANGGLDVPCNTHIYFRVVDGKLDMTVCCRSNDAVWGAYGANLVHFSILMEYVALSAGYGLGKYIQFSNNFHAYPDNLPHPILDIAKDVKDRRMYDYPEEPTPLINSDLAEFNADLNEFIQTNTPSTNSVFFKNVVRPMWDVWSAWKAKDYSKALALTNLVAGFDWRLAAVDWLVNRQKVRENKEKTNG